MNINEVINSIKNPNVEEFIPLEKIKNEEDKQKYPDYNIIFTFDEFKNIFPNIETKYIYYKKGFANVVYFSLENYIYIEFTLDKDLVMLNTMKKKSQTTEEYFLSLIDIRKKEIENKNFKLLLSEIAVPNSISLLFLRELIRKKYENSYELFKDVYFSVDYGFNIFSIEDYKKLLKLKKDFQIELTNNAIKNLPDILTIYRGEGSNSTDYSKSVSWTLDINIAYFFAVKNSTDNARILTAEINKKDIFEYSKRENEILVLPENVTFKSEQNLYNTDIIESTFNKTFINKSFCYGKTLLNQMYNKYCSNNNLESHDKIHSLRVMFLSLIIASQLDCKKHDLYTLVETSVFHDICRENDDVDEIHGLNAYGIYEEYNGKSDLMKFLLTYHCKDDSEAIHYLKQSNILDKENAYKIFSIFKDADALDRVRFGVKDLDINYLRNDISKQMVLVAQMTFLYLKI